MSNKKILVVDDDFEDLSKIKVALEKGGFEVNAATNGAKAIDYLGTEEYAAILVDIRMPTLSGYDLVNLMKERVQKKTKILFISVVPKKEVDMGKVDGFIQKPFNGGDAILKEVKKVLKWGANNND